MKYFVRAGVIALAIFTLMSCCKRQKTVEPEETGKKDHSFSFIAFGDMPYFMPQDGGKFSELISYLNRRDQAFNVFVGDIKASETDCSDSIYYAMYDYFNQSEKPLIYTPGDNEWTDCETRPVHPADAWERLDFVRQVFFKDSTGLGKEKIQLQWQSGYPGYKKFVENNLWSYGGITFATLHVVGSNNHYFPGGSDEENAEYNERNKANLFWLREAFEKAAKDKSPGIVLFLHADMFTADGDISGFQDFLTELNSLTKKFGKPVLVVNGDSHKFLVDKPFMNGNKTVMNFTRIQVFGEYDMEAVKIRIDTTSPELFEIAQVILPNQP